MQGHQLLDEHKRNQRFSVSDAIDVLNERCQFNDDDFAEIHVGGLRLSSSEVVGITNVCFDSAARETTFVVSLATATQFRAIRHGEAKSRPLSIFELDGAKVDNAGSVTLANGDVLRAVDVIPTKSLRSPSELEYRIIHHVIAIAGAEDHCYRSLREHAKPKCTDVPEEMIPDIKVINCSSLDGLDLPTLKFIVRKIGEEDWTLRNLSRQKIADALHKFGMRIPAASKSNTASVLP